jgi:hypothetical protein
MNDVSCCPNLPIRLNALLFEPNKSQRACLRRVVESLSGKRPIALPAVVTDPFLRCMALHREGRGREACEAVLRYRKEGAEAAKSSLQSRALGFVFLSDRGAGGGGEV